MLSGCAAEDVFLMAEIVNLNRYRKALAKKQAGEQAESNRRKHGRSKAEKMRDAAERNRERVLHDGKDCRDDDPEPA